MKKQLIEPHDHASETFSEEINSHFARTLTPFEHEIKESYEDLRTRHRQTNAPYGYMIGFIYAPHQELKIRICSDARDFETQIFAKFSRDPDYRLLFSLDINDPRPFEEQWFDNQTFGRCENYASAFAMYGAGERAHPARVREIIHRHDIATAPTLKNIH